MISGTISLVLKTFFSTFPHGTSALSVTSEYLALAHGQAGFLQGSTCPVVLGNLIHPLIYLFCLQDYHLLWLILPDLSAINMQKDD